jgi:hypothetical protein
MTLTQSSGCLLVTLGLVLACGSPPASPKSPTNDNEPPATTTGNGEVMGADRVSPARKLEESPKLDTRDGVKPAEKPTGD